MRSYIPSFTDITDWPIQVYSNTGGTRSKKITIHPDTHDEYFFKGSKELDSGEIRYPLEFWSEIVASKVGQALGFNMLDYNIAFKQNDKQQIGCLSKSMVIPSESKLTEGKDYLVGYNSQYDPEKDKSAYTFQFICDTLKSYNFEAAIPNIIILIIFDAIIGNSDRHQENWGFITYFKETIDKIDQAIKKKEITWFEKQVLKIWKWSVASHRNLNSSYKLVLMNQSNLAKNRFSPIYDSGCCLGRELSDDAVNKMLKDSAMFNAYVNRGQSEIHWQGDSHKQKHIELVKLLMKEHSGIINNKLSTIEKHYTFEVIEEIITNVDKNLPQELLKFKLPDNRKELMVKIISLRTQQLLALR
jgi:hypothetical protein